MYLILLNVGAKYASHLIHGNQLLRIIIFESKLIFLIMNVCCIKGLTIEDEINTCDAQWNIQQKICIIILDNLSTNNCILLCDVEIFLYSMLCSNIKFGCTIRV